MSEMSTELVQLHHNEPMTTSLAIAACTENEHDSVILLVRKHLETLEEFGEVGFQIAKPGYSRFEIGDAAWVIENCRSKKGRDTQFVFLNELQATLLITFMRNSPLVIKFKVSLVKAFFAMRDQAHAQKIPVVVRQAIVRGSPKWTTDQKYWMRKQAQKIGRTLFFISAMRYVMARMEVWIGELVQEGREITDDLFLDQLEYTSFTDMGDWIKEEEE